MLLLIIEGKKRKKLIRLKLKKLLRSRDVETLRTVLEISKKLWKLTHMWAKSLRLIVGENGPHD